MSQNEELQWHNVADVSDVDGLLPLSVEVDDHGVALYKVNDQVYATVNMCSHEEALLSDGYIDEEEIVCPIHQARFHIPTGKVMCAPAIENICTYPVKIEGNRVFIGLQKSNEE